ncbi:hypothetical protein RhiLY_04905 [Ceratobasidium sp. AG-Ba]|nr:hypothetical protein RhiLY_04905 [Ceratobasidium sp. AG-Ba]
MATGPRKLGRLYTYLTGALANGSTPPAFHGILERLQDNLAAEISASEERIFATMNHMMQSNAQSAQQPRQTTPMRTTAPTNEETPKPLQGTGSTYQDFKISTCFGSEFHPTFNQPKQEPANEEDERQRLTPASSSSERSVLEFDPMDSSTPTARGSVGLFADEEDAWEEA